MMTSIVLCICYFSNIIHIALAPKLKLICMSFYNDKDMIDIILTDEIHLSFPQRSSEHMFENACSYVSSDIMV